MTGTQTCWYHILAWCDESLPRRDNLHREKKLKDGERDWAYDMVCSLDHNVPEGHLAGLFLVYDHQVMPSYSWQSKEC
jgi:hypothetical protein